MAEPKYWGTIKGKILNAIVNEFCDSEDAVVYETHLPLETIKQAIAELLQTGELSYTDEGTLWVKYPLYKSYENFSLDSLTEEMSSKIPLIMDKKKLDTIEWIYQWKTKNDDTITLDTKHFFLKGGLLADFTNDLLKFSRESVFVVNPYVDVCSTTRILSLLKTNGVKTDIITRNPETERNDYSRKRKINWHKTLVEKGVNLYYNDLIHAKMFLIDDIVAINSSMNLFSASVGSQSWESGIISFDETVLHSIRNAIQSLMTSEMTTLT
jgi:hypothetical protein